MIEEELKSLLPGLEFGRKSHVVWRDFYQAYPAMEEKYGLQTGNLKHQITQIEEYDKRIRIIKRAIEYIEMGP